MVLFPYDFRYGVRAAALRLQAEIELRLGGLSRPDRNRRVIMIGHSMGGLVARYWLGFAPCATGDQRTRSDRAR